MLTLSTIRMGNLLIFFPLDVMFCLKIFLYKLACLALATFGPGKRNCNFRRVVTNVDIMHAYTQFRSVSIFRFTGKYY